MLARARLLQGRCRAGTRARLVPIALMRAPTLSATACVRPQATSSHASCKGNDLGNDPVAEFNQELESVFGGEAEAVGRQPDFVQSAAALPETGPRDATPPSARWEPSPQPPATRAGGGETVKLSHVDASGSASMVDVSAKAATRRVAVATGRILLGADAFPLVAANQIAKGDVLTVAQIAGINGAKMTAALIPLCHSILLNRVDVAFRLDEEAHAVNVRAEATAVGPTGVEMEALTAVAVAALTVYDMCKAVNKRIEIQDIRLESKLGGKSGPWHRETCTGSKE